MFIDTLSNGVRVVIDPIDKTSTTTVMIAVNVGSRDETKEINGICHYLEHMAFKGTSNKSADEVNDYIADIGGSVNAYTSYERTVYHLSCLSEHTNSAIDILSEIVLDSSLPEKEMEKEREVIVQEIHMYDDRPDSISYQGGRFALFGDNPLGWDIIGTADNVRNITQNTLYGFYKSNYTPDRITISVAGNVNVEEVYKKIQSIFSPLKSNNELVSNRKFNFFEGDFTHQRPDNQISIHLMWPGLSAIDKNSPTMDVLCDILTGSMSSRLFREIRERQGLCYGIGSYNQSHDDCGVFTISSGTTPELTEKLISTIAVELKKSTSFINDTELSRSCIAAATYLAMKNDSTSARASSNLKDIIVHNKIFSLEEEIELIKSVSNKDVENLLSRILQTKPVISIVGQTEQIDIEKMGDYFS